MERINKNVLNCPNCGQPITNATCQYCGTIFYDFSNLELGGAGYVRLKIADKLLIFKELTTNVTFEIESSDSRVLYFDNKPMEYFRPANYHVTIEMDIVEDDNGILFEKRDKRWKEKVETNEFSGQI